jgi:hypothetical protein
LLISKPFSSKAVKAEISSPQIALATPSSI